MVDVKFYIAEVVDNNDLDQEGKVQVKILGLTDGLTVADYPWIKPANVQLTGGSSDHGKSCIPEIGGMLWVFFADAPYFQKGFYLADLHLNDNNPHTLFQNHVKAQISSASLYPDTKYIYFENGICIAVDSSDTNPEISIFHPTNSYIFIDKLGKIKVKNVQDIEIESAQSVKVNTVNNIELTAVRNVKISAQEETSVKSMGSLIVESEANDTTIKAATEITIDSALGVEIKGGAMPTENMVKGQQLLTALQSLCDACAAITTSTIELFVPMPINNASTFTNIKATLSNILSVLNKNN